METTVKFLDGLPLFWSAALVTLVGIIVWHTLINLGRWIASSICTKRTPKTKTNKGNKVLTWIIIVILLYIIGIIACIALYDTPNDGIGAVFLMPVVIVAVGVFFIGMIILVMSIYEGNTFEVPEGKGGNY